MPTEDFNIADYVFGQDGIQAKVTIGVDTQSTIYLTVGIFVALLLALFIYGLIFGHKT